MSWRSMRVIFNWDGTTRPPRTRVKRLSMMRATKVNLVRALMRIMTEDNRSTFDVEDFRDACEEVLHVNPRTSEERVESRMHRRLAIMCGKHQQQAGTWFVRIGYNEYRLTEFAVEASAKGSEASWADLRLRTSYMRLRRELKRQAAWSGPGLSFHPPEAWDIVLGCFWAQFPFGGTIDDLIAVIGETNAEKESGMKVSTNRTTVKARVSELCKAVPPRMENIERGVYRAIIPHAGAIVAAAEPKRGRVAERSLKRMRGYRKLTEARRRMNRMVEERLLERDGEHYRLPTAVRSALRDPFERAALLVTEDASQAPEE